MTAARAHLLFVNIAHFLDHFFMLIFATAAALTLARDWGMGYAELIPYATPGFVAFAVFALPAGWLADRWSRQAMMAVFFVGIGLSAIATALADTPLAMAAGLFAIGVFAAIYHPVGIALVVQDRVRTGVPLAVNGVFGNLGVASAALITAVVIDHAGWRAAFVWPGAVSVVLGIAYIGLVSRMAGLARVAAAAGRPVGAKAAGGPAFDRALLVRVFAVVFASTALGGLIFQSTTFALPEIFDQRLGDIAGSATRIGWFAFLVFAVASMGQLVVGFLIDRFPARHIFMLVAAAQASLFAVMPGLTGWAAVGVAMGFMLAAFGQIPINDALVGRFTRPEFRSRVYAARYLVNFSVVASAVPAIAWISGRWGFDTLFVVLAAAAAVMLAAVSMLPATRTAAVAAE